MLYAQPTPTPSVKIVPHIGALHLSQQYDIALVASRPKQHAQPDFDAEASCYGHDETGTTRLTATGQSHSLHDDPSASAGKLSPRIVDRALRRHIGSKSFPCVGAKGAFNCNAYRFGLYESMGAQSSTTHLAQHLMQFARDADDLRGSGQFSTFIAVFEAPDVPCEHAFEHLLWRQLKELNAHDVDRWDASVSHNPSDPDFSFSLGGRAFFVVGLHQYSSRLSRQLPWPTLVFNPHDQFTQLRESGRMAKMQQAIRKRDKALQGSINPNLSDFGDRSDARQYSGRRVDDDWAAPVETFDAAPERCPFGHGS